MGKAAKALGGAKKAVHARAGTREGGQFIGKATVLHAIVELLRDRQQHSEPEPAKKAAPGKSTAAKKLAAKAPAKKAVAKKAPAAKGAAAKKLAAPTPSKAAATGKSLKKVGVGDYDVHMDGAKVGSVQQHVGVQGWRAFPAASTGLPQMLPGKYATRKAAVDALFAAIDDAKKKPEVGDKHTSVLSPPTGKFELLDDPGKSGDGYAPGGQWGIYGSAGVLIRHTGGGEPRFLLIQRSDRYIGKEQGKWQLPGGGRDEKENAYQAAARELQEETGASAGFIANLQPVGEQVYAPDSTGWTYTTLAADSNVDFVPNVSGSESTGDARWFTVAELEAMRDNGDLTKKTAKSLLPIVEAYPAAPAPDPSKTGVTGAADEPTVVSMADIEDMAGDGLFDVPLAYGVNPANGRLLKIVAWPDGGDHFFNLHQQNPDGSWDEAFMSGASDPSDFTHDYDGKPEALAAVTWYGPVDKAGNPPPDLAKVPSGGGQGQGPKGSSIYDPVDSVPAGATKAPATILAAAASGWDTDAPTGWTGSVPPQVRRVKVPTKSGFGKVAYDYYFDNIRFGTVEQSSYGGWTASDPNGTSIGYSSTSQSKAVQQLVDRYDQVHELIAKGEAKATAAQAAAKAKAAAQEAAAVARAGVEADRARLRGRSPKPTEAEKAIYGGDFSQLTRVGPQGGFTEGGVFEAPDGSRWYVKAQLSPDHAANEALAVDFYRAAGVDIPEVIIGADTPGMTPGSHTATRLLDTVSVSLKDRIKGNGWGVAADHRFIRRAHEGFAVDAWLGNWDVAGENPAGGYDNVVDLDGRPVRIDAGGALLFRGTGGPKGDQFGPAVTEWERFTDTQSTKAAAALFDTIRREDMIASAERVKAITPAKIRAMVKARGLDPSLSDTLVERRKDIISRAKAEAKKPRKPFGQGALTEHQAKASIPLTLTSSYDFEATLHSFGVSKLDSLAATLSLKAYKGSGYKPINRYLYGQGAADKVHKGKTSEEHVRDLDIAFAHSALTQDILVHQGSRGPGRMFPPGEWSLVGGMEGKEFTVEAFWSSSVNPSTAESFARDYGGGGGAATAQPTVMKLVIPKGTAVIDLVTEGEVLLNRGLRYRVVKDRGVDSGGVRRLDVEVI